MELRAVAQIRIATDQADFKILTVFRDIYLLKFLGRKPLASAQIGISPGKTRRQILCLLQIRLSERRRNFKAKHDSGRD
jgi:hypothetical protein